MLISKYHFSIWAVHTVNPGWSFIQLLCKPVESSLRLNQSFYRYFNSLGANESSEVTQEKNKSGFINSLTTENHFQTHVPCPFQGDWVRHTVLEHSWASCTEISRCWVKQSLGMKSCRFSGVAFADVIICAHWRVPAELFFFFTIKAQGRVYEAPKAVPQACCECRHLNFL